MTESDHTITSADVASGVRCSIAPSFVQFSSDADVLTYLYPDSSGIRNIIKVPLKGSNWESSKLFDANTTEINESEEETLRRERMRLFSRGVTSYQWIKRKPDGKQLLMIPLGGQIYVAFLNNYSTVSSVLVYDAVALGPAIDPHWSPDGLKIAFVITSDLYFIDLSNEDYLSGPVSNHSKAPKRLTILGENNGLSCGLADYIAQEEMDRYEGFWWAPDSIHIAVAVVDEKHIPDYRIQHPGSTDPAKSETHKYPFAGAANPIVKLAVLSIEDNIINTETSSFDTLPTLTYLDIAMKNLTQIESRLNDEYLCRAGWWRDGSVMVQVEDRRQTRLQLLRVDPVTGVSTLLLEEQSDVWINLHNLLYVFEPTWRPSNDVAKLHDPEDFYFLWGSELSGFFQLYLCRYDSHAKTAAVEVGPIGGGGAWVVDSIDAVDEDRNLVYFSASAQSVTERHLYRASLENYLLSPVKLTQEPGWHMATVSTQANAYVDVFCNVNQPPVTTLYQLPSLVSESPQGDLLSVLARGADFLPDWDSKLRHCPVPVLQTVPAADRTPLWCALYIPDALKFGPGPYPTIVSVYGGPHVQRVMNHWQTRADLRCLRLAQEGFLVIKCDNRGSYRRGSAFEGAIKNDMGRVEIEDQVTVVNYFARHGSADYAVTPNAGLVDISRVGIFGWSYGGYLSAMAVCRAPEVFRCAIAGAPVTHWDGYDTHYTERYMGLPAENSLGYDISSVMHHTSKMREDCRLMLVHGLIDENVHFRHTARLINALTRCRKRYDLLLFPDERHSPHGMADRILLEDRIQEYFNTALTK